MKNQQPINVGSPTISFSRASYLKVEARLRDDAKRKKTLLVTRDGIEDYRSEKMVFLKGKTLADAEKMCEVQKLPDPKLAERIRKRQAYKAK